MDRRAESKVGTLILLLGLCFNALGTDKPAPKVVYKKSETHSFNGLKLKGELKKPELSYIYKRKGLRAEQIVNIPENFNDEIVQGAGQF